MSDKEPVLLIAYKYPPYSQVGAFRWTRFSKYLAELGHEIEVVTVNWKLPDFSNLSNEVSHSRINIHRIRSGYLHNFKNWRSGNRWVNALKNRFFARLLDRYFFWDDEAQHWGRYLLPKCEELIKEKGIRTVIATGSPFQSNVWAAELKRRNPTICMIHDLRDPWVRNPLKWYRDYSAALAMERDTLSIADHLVVVSHGMAEHFMENLSREVPVTVINNGFDPLMLQHPKPRHGSEDSIRVVYVGSLSNGREDVLRQLLDVLEKKQIETVQVIVVGNYTYALKRRYQGLIELGILQFEGWVSQEKALEIVASADYALQLNAKIFPYALSTKIFEYAAIGIPTLSLNFGGDIDKLIRDYSLGYSVNLNNDDLNEWILRLASNELNRLFSFSIDDFSYSKLAMKYSELIQESSEFISE